MPGTAGQGQEQGQGQGQGQEHPCIIPGTKRSPPTSAAAFWRRTAACNACYGSCNACARCAAPARALRNVPPCSWPSVWPPFSLRAPRRHIAIPPPIIPFNQNGRLRRAFGGGDRGLRGEPLAQSRAPPFCSALLYVHSPAGRDALADATARAAKQSRDDDDEDSGSGSGSGSAGGAQSRAGASLVIIPTGVVALLRNLSSRSAGWAGAGLALLFAWLWPVLTQVLLVQHDARLPGWKGAYQILSHFVTTALSPQGMKEAEPALMASVTEPLLQRAVRLVLHCAPMAAAADIRGGAPPAELLNRLVTVALQHDVPLGALLDTDGGLYGKYKAGRALAAAALLHGCRCEHKGRRRRRRRGGRRQWRHHCLRCAKTLSF